ncbi:metal-sulfur cluster assembly factor [Lacticaseibacillus brantae]|uniref:Metal-sulfur cluster biosynthetic enzyme n=1 Tax=Lacticaseibacillus brantae DSM 23927 TaxID=1423727 RepID=A0A0R2B0B5_9LACO|nr:metal-sulfur cluster assembly factor [Lacticaseibacillus brantae]KRM72687.1 metal-sulfur cluster biosynthetic enzyme [Lacticaseibacillus brantae DSM 23927]
MPEEAYQEAMRTAIVKALETVIDPELGVDIINLGLVYGVDLDETGQCTVEMTLTTMGCPLSDILDHDVRQSLLAVDGINSVELHLVWYPAWGPERMSRYAKMALGMH